ncbi:MAG: hypothetical protein LBM07_06330 [Culturomica sp.]|nr:hypothetical protein [Culturomica sp.]
MEFKEVIPEHEDLMNTIIAFANELKKYPQVSFRWKETGLFFQVQFVKLDYMAEQELGQEQELQQELQ